MGIMDPAPGETVEEYLEHLSRRQAALVETLNQWPHTVYALIDPRTQAVRWVGCTSDVKARYQSHIHQRNKSNPIRQAWIDDLKSEGLRPTLSILDSDLPKREALDREIYWLQWHVRHGSPLTNMRDVERCAEELWVEPLDQQSAG